MSKVTDLIKSKIISTVEKTAPPAVVKAVKEDLNKPKKQTSSIESKPKTTTKSAETKLTDSKLTTKLPESSNITSALSLQQQINPLLYFQQSSPVVDTAVAEKAKEAPKVFTQEGAKEWATQELAKPVVVATPVVTSSPTTQDLQDSADNRIIANTSGMSQSTLEALQGSEYGKVTTPTIPTVPIMSTGIGTAPPTIINPADRTNPAVATPPEYYADPVLAKTDTTAGYIERRTPSKSKPKSILGGLTGGYLPGTEPPEKQYFIGRTPGDFPADFVGPIQPDQTRGSQSIYLPKSEALSDFGYMPESSQHQQLLKNLDEQKNTVRPVQETILTNLQLIKDNPDVDEWELDVNNDGAPELINRSEALKYYTDKQNQVSNYISSLDNQKSIIKNISELGYSVTPTDKGWTYSVPTTEEVYSHVYKDDPLPYLSQAFWSGDFGVRPAAVYAASKLLNKPEWWEAEDTRIKQYGLEGASMASKTEQAGGQGWFPHLMQTGASPTSQDIAMYLGTAGLGFGVGQLARHAGSKVGTSTLSKVGAWLAPKTSIGRAASKVGGYGLGGGLMFATEYPHLKEVYETNPDLLPGELASSGVKAFLGWRGFKTGMDAGVKWDPTEFNPEYGAKEIRTTGATQTKIYPELDSKYLQSFSYTQDGVSQSATVRPSTKGLKITQKFDPTKSRAIGHGFVAKETLVVSPQGKFELLDPDKFDDYVKEGWRFFQKGSVHTQGGGLGGTSKSGRFQMGGESNLKPYTVKGTSLSPTDDTSRLFETFAKVQYPRDPNIDDMFMKGITYVDDVLQTPKGVTTMDEPFTGRVPSPKNLKIQKSLFRGETTPVPPGYQSSKVQTYGRTLFPEDDVLVKITSSKSDPYALATYGDDITKMKIGRPTTPFFGSTDDATRYALGTSDDVARVVTSKGAISSSDDVARIITNTDDLSKGVISSSDDLARNTDDFVTTKKSNGAKSTTPKGTYKSSTGQTVIFEQDEAFDPLVRSSLQSHFGQLTPSFIPSQASKYASSIFSLAPLGLGIGTFSGTMQTPKSKNITLPSLRQITIGQPQKLERKDISSVKPIFATTPTFDTLTKTKTDQRFATIFDTVPAIGELQDSETETETETDTETDVIPETDTDTESATDSDTEQMQSTVPISLLQFDTTPYHHGEGTFHPTPHPPGIITPFIPLKEIEESPKHYGYKKSSRYGKGYKERKYQVRDMWSFTPPTKSKKKPMFFSIVK